MIDKILKKPLGFSAIHKRQIGPYIGYIQITILICDDFLLSNFELVEQRTMSQNQFDRILLNSDFTVSKMNVKNNRILASFTEGNQSNNIVLEKSLFGKILVTLDSDKRIKEGGIGLNSIYDGKIINRSKLKSFSTGFDLGLLCKYLKIYSLSGKTNDAEVLIDPVLQTQKEWILNPNLFLIKMKKLGF